MVVEIVHNEGPLVRKLQVADLTFWVVVIDVFSLIFGVALLFIGLLTLDLDDDLRLGGGLNLDFGLSLRCISLDARFEM